MHAGLDFESSEVEAEVSIGDATADEGGERPTAPPRPMRWLVLAAVLVALGALASFFLGAAGLLSSVIILVVAVGVIVCLAQAVRLAGRRRQYGLAMRLAESASMQRADVIGARQEQFRRARRELESTLAGLGVDDVAAAEALLAAVESKTEALAHIEGELRRLAVKESNMRRLVEARDEAANETKRASHALVAMGHLADDPASTVLKVQRLLAQTLPARDAARSEEDQAQGRVDANQVDAEVVVGLSERLAAARDRQAVLERRILIYQGTLTAIESAERATLKTAARYLEERMGPMMARFDDGSGDDDIEVDERDLAFRVRAPETGEFVDVRQLSHRHRGPTLPDAAPSGALRSVHRSAAAARSSTIPSSRRHHAWRACRPPGQTVRRRAGFQVMESDLLRSLRQAGRRAGAAAGSVDQTRAGSPRRQTRTSSAADQARAKSATAAADRREAPSPTLRVAPDAAEFWSRGPSAWRRRRRPQAGAKRERHDAGADRSHADRSHAARSLAPSPRSRAAAAGRGPGGERSRYRLESLRRAAEAATEAERDTGIADPSGLRRRPGDEAPD